MFSDYNRFLDVLSCVYRHVIMVVVVWFIRLIFWSVHISALFPT